MDDEWHAFIVRESPGKHLLYFVLLFCTVELWGDGGFRLDD